MSLPIYAAATIFGLLFIGWGATGGDDGTDATDAHGHDGGLWALFSIRNLAFGALTFGGVGAIGSLARWSPVTTAVIAGVLGTAVWVAVSMLFRYLKRSQSGALLSDASWIGSEAELVVPFGPDGVGRISATLGGQITELPARRAPAFATMASDAFRRCQIEQLDDSTAVVTPLSQALLSK